MHMHILFIYLHSHKNPRSFHNFANTYLSILIPFSRIMKMEQCVLNEGIPAIHGTNFVFPFVVFNFFKFYYCWPEFFHRVLNVMLFRGVVFIWVWVFWVGLWGFFVMWTHLIQSLVICMSNLKFCLSVCHLLLCSHKAQLPLHHPICPVLISHPEEYGLLWPTLEWSCSDMTLYNKTRDSCFSVLAVTELRCRWQKVSSCLLNG